MTRPVSLLPLHCKPSAESLIERDELQSYLAICDPDSVRRIQQEMSALPLLFASDATQQHATEAATTVNETAFGDLHSSLKGLNSTVFSLRGVADEQQAVQVIQSTMRRNQARSKVRIQGSAATIQAALMGKQERKQCHDVLQKLRDQEVISLLEFSFARVLSAHLFGTNYYMQYCRCFFQLLANWVDARGDVSRRKEEEASHRVPLQNPAEALVGELHSSLKHTVALQRGIDAMQDHNRQLRSSLQEARDREASLQTQLQASEAALKDAESRARAAEVKAAQALRWESASASRHEVLRLTTARILKESLIDDKKMTLEGMTIAEARVQHLEGMIRLAIDSLNTTTSGRAVLSSGMVGPAQSKLPEHMRQIDFSQVMEAAEDDEFHTPVERNIPRNTELIGNLLESGFDSDIALTNVVHRSICIDTLVDCGDTQQVDASIPDELADIEQHIEALYAVGHAAQPG